MTALKIRIIGLLIKSLPDSSFKTAMNIAYYHAIRELPQGWERDL